MQPIFRPTDQTIDYRPEGGDKTVVNQSDTDTNSSLGNVSVSSPPGYEIRKELGRGGWESSTWLVKKLWLAM